MSSGSTVASGRRQLHVRTILLLNHLPVLVFTCVILLISAVVIGWLLHATGDLASEAAAGAPVAAEIRSLGEVLSWVWTGCLVTFLIAAGSGLAVAGRAHRCLTRRLDRLAAYADTITRGDVGEAPAVRSDDSLGDVESSLAELGRSVAQREEELRRDAARRRFEGKLHHALEMAPTEEAVTRVVRRAFAQIDAELAIEVLLADSSQAHLRRAVASEPAEVMTSCGVASPADCPATRGGSTRVFPDAGELDACPHLQLAVAEPCGAVCVPLSIAGRTVGVIHARTPASQRPHPTALDGLDAVAAGIGTRLGMIRALQSSELAASTDPLTGLVNRRSMETRFGEESRKGTACAVAMSDIDHFKRLNDTHGHEAGDRALRVFARVLEEAVRSDDVVCRFGGEEFVLILPGCPMDQATRIVEQIRRSLPARAAEANVPAFTASFGVVQGQRGSELDALLRTADAALYEAKAGGRNRTVVAGRGVIDPDAPEQAPAADLGRHPTVRPSRDAMAA